MRVLQRFHVLTVPVYLWKYKWERAEAKIMLIHINDHSKDNPDIPQNNKDEGLKHPSILPSVYLCLSTSGSWWGWSLSQLPWSKRWSGPRTGHQSVAALTQTTIPSHSYGHFRITNLTHTDHANSTQKGWLVDSNRGFSVCNATIPPGLKAACKKSITVAIKAPWDDSYNSKRHLKVL